MLIFRVDVDLTKIFLYEKVLFITQFDEFDEEVAGKILNVINGVSIYIFTNRIDRMSFFSIFTLRPDANIL